MWRVGVLRFMGSQRIRPDWVTELSWTELYASQLWNVYFVVVFACCNIVLGFPVSSVGKESTCNVGDLGSIPWLGRSPGGGHGNPLQYSCLENLHELRSLVGYNTKGHKELHMTEWLSTQHYIRHRMHSQFYWISAAVVVLTFPKREDEVLLLYFKPSAKDLFEILTKLDRKLE